ncbi:MAG: VCBS repeat-containing protein [Planctomycetota bacterium]
MDSENRITNRRDLQIAIDQSRFALVPKAEARPFLIDWNRDGIEDLVVALLVADRTRPRTGPMGYCPRLFIKYGSSSRQDEIENGLNQRHVTTSPPQMFTPQGGADLVVNLEPVEFGNGIEEHWDGLSSQRWRIFAEFAFGDVDSDGNFDLIFSERAVRVVVDQDTGLQRMEHSQSAVYWMKNTSSTGAPEFDVAREIFSPDPQQPVISLNAADFDQDGKLDVIVQSPAGLHLLSQTE